jgi:hypothetical protein
MRPRRGAGAQYLGIDTVFSGARIWLAGMWCYAAGILNPAMSARRRLLGPVRMPLRVSRVRIGVRDTNPAGRASTPDPASGGWAHSRAHSLPAATVHRRPRATHRPRSRTMAALSERGLAVLESVLGATPQEFESPILRHPDQAGTRVPNRGRGCGHDQSRAGSRTARDLRAVRKATGRRPDYGARPG